MYQRATVTMSMRELDRLKVIQAVVDGELRAGLAAERLGRCARQVRRLAQRYRMEGPVGLISRRRNRPGNRRIPEDLENRIASEIVDRRSHIWSAKSYPGAPSPDIRTKEDPGTVGISPKR
jgi:hypothetical protein